MLDIAARHAAGRVAIDIGANEGLYTDRLRKTAAQVIAFEPLPGLAASLRARYPDVRVECCALSDTDGTLPLFVPLVDGKPVHTRASLDAHANPGLALRQEAAQVRRLDDFEFLDVGLIKIDVEGHEAAVLKGAANTISRHRPALIVEIEERHHAGESGAIVSGLVARGYRVFYHLDGRLQEFLSIDFQALQPSAAAKSPFGKADPNYVNNFLFLHSDQSLQAP